MAWNRGLRDCLVTRILDSWAERSWACAREQKGGLE